MAGLYMRNGSLLVNSVGTALQGCCCQTDCGDQVPTTLFATIIDDNANCPCIDGDTSVITLTRSAETGHWSGSGEFGSCGVTIHLELQCSSDGEWTLETSDCAVDSVIATTAFLDPVDMHFEFFEELNDCCTESDFTATNIRITE